MEGKTKLLIGLSAVVVIIIGIASVIYFGLMPPINGEISNVRQLERMIRKNDDFSTVFIDVRSQSEYQEGHIEGFYNVPIKSPDDKLDKYPNEGDLLLAYLELYDKDKQIVFMCGSGTRSARAVEIAREAGYTNIVDFTIGFNGYMTAKGEGYDPATGDCGCIGDF